MTSSHDNLKCAPWINVLATEVVSIEHPGVVANIDKAMESLGGPDNLRKFLDAGHENKAIGLRLRPNDPFRRPIMSDLSKSSNIVLKISVPLRTGRRRRRGSGLPFEDGASDSGIPSKASHILLESMRGNVHRYEICAAGTVEETYHFRSLPDFQYSMACSSLVNRLRKTIVPFEYEKLKDFKMDLSLRGVQEDMDMIPPPSFAQFTSPFHYSYFQNPGVKLTHDSEGRLTSMNTNAPRRTQSQLADFNCKQVPVASDPNLPPLEQLDANMRGLVEKLREIMDNRPICTRRVLANLVASEALSDIRYAIQYVGYIFKAGPWRDAVTKFGIDPRSDPKYREYQTMFFKIVLRDETKVWNDGRTKYNRSLQEKGEPSNKQSHVFDGTKVTADGKIWQMCDITDPLLRQILDDPSALRQTCESRSDGWYQNGAWAKIRVIMRDKIAIIMSGIVPSGSDYSRLIDIPHTIHESNTAATSFRHGHTHKEMTLATEIRSMARMTDLRTATDGDEARRGSTAALAAADDDDENLRIDLEDEMDEDRE